MKNIIEQRENELIEKNIKILEHREKVEKEKIETMISLSKSIVHEVKTPITVIEGFTYLSKNKIDKFLKNFINKNEVISKEFLMKVVEYLNEISKETQRIDYLASGLLEYAGKDQYKYKIKDVKLKKIIDLIYSVWSDELEKLDIYFENSISDDKIVKTDNEKIIKIFDQVIKNSIENFDLLKEKKYIRIFEKEGEKNKIIIEDNGLGIKEELISEVFKPMVTTKIQGTGLGLCIVKVIMEKQNYNVFIESEEGNYTRLILDFNSLNGDEK